MKTEILIIGGGASGLMAAYGAAKTLVESGVDAQVTVLEKMPRPGRKIMITGKGRCNFTNLKDWNEFSGHIRSKSNFVKSAFYNLTSQGVLDFFEKFGMQTVVERGDRAFPASYHASDVVDTLVSACQSLGVKLLTEREVVSVESTDKGFEVTTESSAYGVESEKWICSKLIVATGGLSYPNTGSTGDGYKWAAELGHKIVPCFPSLTAMVPKGYKDTEDAEPEQVPLNVATPSAEMYRRFHIDRSMPLSEVGKALCGIQLKNIGLTLEVEGTIAENEFGDIDFTDGGIEGPIGFQVSRKCVKSLINGSRVSVVLDLKPGVPLTELMERIQTLWKEVDKDPRSARLREKEKCRVLLGKLMPWDLIPAFRACHPEIMTLEHRGREKTKVWVNLLNIAKALKEWRFDIAGYVGYERCVVTAGGVSTDDLIAKTLESRVVPGMYFVGEVLDVDSDTGGYNLQTAFSTGMLAGISAAKSL